MHRRSLPFLWPLLLGQFAAAQVPDLPFERAFGSTWMENTEGMPLPLTFERIALGDVDGDGRVDALVRRRLDDVRGAVLLLDVNTWNAPRTLGVADDIAVLPVAGGGVDRLVLLRPQQLVLVDVPGGGAQTALAAPAMQRLFTVRRSTGDGLLLGLDDQGHQLHRFEWNGATLAPLSSLPMPIGVRDVQGLDWNGDGVQELVVLFDDPGIGTWFSVVPLAGGAPLASWPIALPGTPPPNLPRIAVSRGSAADPAPANCDLVLVHTPFANGHAVFAFGSGTGTSYVDLGPMPASAFVGFDLDGDGRGDVAIADPSSSHLTVLQRTAAATLVVAGTAALANGPSLPQAGIDAVAAADLDGDGDGDLLAAQSGPRILHEFDSAVATSRRIQADPDLGAFSWLPQTGAQILPVHVQIPESAAAGGVAAIRWECYLQESELHEVSFTPFAADSELWNGQATQTISFQVPAVGDSPPIVHLHLRLVLDGVDQAGAVWFVTEPNSNTAYLVGHVVELERGGTGLDGGGEGSVSGNKGNHKSGSMP